MMASSQFISIIMTSLKHLPQPKYLPVSFFSTKPIVQLSMKHQLEFYIFYVKTAGYLASCGGLSVTNDVVKATEE